MGATSSSSSCQKSSAASTSSSDDETLLQPVKHLTDVVGQWGPWQRHLFAFCVVVGVFTALNNMGYAFHAPPTDYWCIDHLDGSGNGSALNDSNTTLERGALPKCRPLLRPNESCQNWAYDTSLFEATIISEFDLVCDRSWLASMTQALYMFGFVISGLVFAHLSDKRGRRPVIWIGFGLEVVFGLSCAFSANIWQYGVSRLLLGMGSSARGLALFTLLVECIGPKYRSDVGILIGIGWIAGYAVLPLLAYWLRNFRHLQICTSLPLILMTFWFRHFYESPRWQLIHGRLDDAERTIRRALKANGRSDVGLRARLERLQQQLKIEEKAKEKQNSVTALDLLKTPNMCRYTLIFWFAFAVNAFVYYGISLNIGDFSKASGSSGDAGTPPDANGMNLFINFALAGLVEAPSLAFCVLALRYIGRQKLTAANLAVAGSACLAIIPVIAFMATPDAMVLQVGLILVAKFCINTSFCIIYVYVAEILPTVLRNTGLGTSVVAGRVGSISAPFAKEFAQSTSMSFVMLCYGTLSIVNACLMLVLPETRGREMPDTLEEAEHFERTKAADGGKALASIDDEQLRVMAVQMDEKGAVSP